LKKFTMDKKALSDITVFNKYAKYLPGKSRRENYIEISHRNRDMHIRKYPQLADQIRAIYTEFVDSKKILPSMRSMQFGGRPIELAENRIFNCAYFPIEHTRAYAELMFLLLGGTGAGYSVQKRHTTQMPKVKAPESDGEYKFQIQDSIIGWADAIKVVAKAFLKAGTLPVFDYRDIREKGTDLITTGGKAPGPEPLRRCIELITAVFRNAVGRRLRPIEVHDICCFIADSVRAGGIRRAAMIALFDRDDEEMLKCKSPITLKEWQIVDATTRVVYFVDDYQVAHTKQLQEWEFNFLTETGTFPWGVVYPARARANNSAVLPRGEVSEEEFRDLMKVIQASGCGEPGVYWTNNPDWGTNPCCEIALRPYQMCNLTTINVSAIHSQEDYNQAAAAAAFIGTLQAGYTDFHYLNPKWKITCEEDALLGVSMTGIASGNIDNLSKHVAAHSAIQMNQEIAKQIGINPAARITTVKPEGTSSLVLGTSSGIHSWHAPYYIRRMRAGKDEALAQYMQRAVPALVEEDLYDSNQVVLSFPQKAPEGATTRHETMDEFLERVKDISQAWVHSGHIKGDNRHNVSCTVSVKSDEWADLADWMWDHRGSYNGISVMPFFGSADYPQAPFEDITKEQYEAMLPLLAGINIGHIIEMNGNEIDLAGEAACAGGVCEAISFTKN